MYSFCDGSFHEVDLIVSEKMFGLSGVFKYKKCLKCNTLQLTNPPNSLERFYPDTYYSLTEKVTNRNKISNWLRFQRDTFELGRFSLSGAVATILVPNLSFRYFRSMTNISRASRILDVGCGSGQFLYNLKAHGFKSLTGIDPYMLDRKTTEVTGGLNLWAKELHQINETYNLLIFNHVFEHLPNPNKTLLDAKKCIPIGGYILIRVPLSDSFAYAKYSENWVQLDAPRHYVLYTRRALIDLFSKHGFLCLKQDDDSSDFQFWGSILYQANEKLSPYISNKTAVLNYFGRIRLLYFKMLSRLLNIFGRGDQGIFLFQRIA